MREATALATRPGAFATGGARPLGLGIDGLGRLGGGISPDLLRRARPLLAAAAAGLVLLLAWSWLSAPARVAVFPGLSDADKAAVSQALEAGGFDVTLDSGTGAVEVPAADLHRARMALAAQGLPKAVPGGYDLLGDMPLGASRALERARLKQAQEGELARAIEGMGGVRSARVMLALPDPSPFVREKSDPSASVFVSLQSGRALGEAQVRAIQHLVAASTPGLSTDRVSVVDGSGQLLSLDTEGGDLGETARELAYRARMERLYRERAVALLTPVLGPGNFTTQVNLDLDFTRSEATSERYAPDNTALRSEAQSNRQDATPQPRGIPGALSNVAPPAAQVAPGPNPQTPATDGPVPPPATATNTESSVTRNFEVGREVSVRKAPVGVVRKMTIAVIVRSGTPSQVDTKALQSLLGAALGFDRSRGDVVTVIRQNFAVEEALAELPWWRKLLEAHLGKLIALVGVIALALLARPLLRGPKAEKPARALEPVAADAAPAPGEDAAPGLALTSGEDMAALPSAGTGAEPGEIDADLAARLAAVRSRPSAAAEILSAANSYDDKVAAIRLFVADDTARASSVMKRLLVQKKPEKA